MGYDYDNSKVIKICIIGGSKEIIEKIFPDNMSVPKDAKYAKRKLYQKIEAKDYVTGNSSKYKIYWEAFIFPNLTNENEESIMKSILFNIFGIPEEEENQNLENNNKLISKNNIIIKFGSNNIEFLLECTDFLSRVYLPQIAIITNSEVRGIQDNRFLTIIKENIQTKLYKNIFNYLWERECYFNQRGNLINEYSPDNLIPSEDLTSSSLNIMLTGMSRAGKSTLINILSEKLVSLETPEFISVTTEINEYIIYKKIREKEIIKLKFIDTPGLTFIPEKKIDTTQIVIDSINKKLKEYNDTNESIHIIYFFMAGIPNLEQSKNFFKYLNDLNDERIKGGLPKLPILFVFNHNSSTNNFDALKKFLIENNYNNLYEEGEKKGNKTDSLKEKIRLKKDQNLNFIKDNIIGINLLKEYNKGIQVTNVFGISDLLKATKYFIQKANPFKDEDFNNIKYFIKEFKNYNLIIDKGEKLTKEQEEKLKLLKEKCRNLMIKISRENSLLYKLNNQNQIIEKAKNEAYTIIYITSSLGFMAGMIPIPFIDLPILYPMYLGMIIKIGNCFNINLSEIPKKVIARLIFGLGADVQSSAKILGNGVGAKAGENLGMDLVYDIGEEQVKTWSIEGLHIVKKRGNVNVGEVAEELIVKNESKFNNLLTYIYNLFPSFRKGVKNGIENGGQQLGKNLENVLIENTINLSGDFVTESSQNIGKIYGEKLVANAGGYLSNLTPKLIPILGILIGGVMDFYSTYNIGKDSIKYFEEYVKKTMGCEFIIKRKEEYEKILNSLDIMANNNFENFKINILN